MVESVLAKGYRQRAEELRRIAAVFTHDDARHDLIKVAKTWEAMALRLEATHPLGAMPSLAEYRRRKAKN